MSEPKKNRKGGRRCKPAADLRTYAVNVRWSVTEAKTLEKWRAASGYSQLAAYIRETVMKQGAPRATVPKSNRLKWAELARLSANLNQFAGHLNKGHIIESKSVVAALARSIEETSQKLDVLRDELLGLRGNLDDTEDNDG